MLLDGSKGVAIRLTAPNKDVGNIELPFVVAVLGFIRPKIPPSAALIPFSSCTTASWKSYVIQKI